MDVRVQTQHEGRGYQHQDDLGQGDTSPDDIERSPLQPNRKGPRIRSGDSDEEGGQWAVRLEGFPELIPVSLSEVIEQCRSLACSRHHLPETALEFANRLPAGGAGTVLGDPDDLRTAVLNLLDNAVKYSGQSVHVLVELAAGERDQFLVRVRDQGIGIPNKELKTIFERFHRIRNSATARVKGTGLGLFIVNSVAKRHRGRVFAESGGAGLGSTFTLQLPVATPTEKKGA